MPAATCFPLHPFQRAPNSPANNLQFSFASDKGADNMNKREERENFARGLERHVVEEENILEE
jgi:hypothetical protein